MPSRMFSRPSVLPLSQADAASIGRLSVSSHGDGDVGRHPFMPSLTVQTRQLPSENLRDRVASLYAPSDGIRWDVEASGDLGSGQRFGANCQAKVSTRVVRLLSPGCPSTISRFVVAVIVDAFECQPVRSAHVCEEQIEPLPSLTDGYSAPSIEGELRALFSKATVTHRPPDTVFGEMRQAMSPSHDHHCNSFGVCP